MRIGLLTIATGEKYYKFILPLLESAYKYFLPNHDRSFFLFSDCKTQFGGNIIQTKVQPKGYPNETLLRYHTFLEHEELFRDIDYLFYSDVDMLFCDYVGKEVIGDLVATLHPGYTDRRGTYESNPKSTAYMDGVSGEYYFCGGFNGGKTKNYLNMAKTIRERIDVDSKNGIVAVWHDESHLNKYLSEVTPTKILTPSYCYPEPPQDKTYAVTVWRRTYEPKLLALNKDFKR